MMQGGVIVYKKCIRELLIELSIENYRDLFSNVRHSSIKVLANARFFFVVTFCIPEEVSMSDKNLI